MVAFRIPSKGGVLVTWKLNSKGFGAIAIVSGVAAVSVLAVTYMSQMGLETFRRGAQSYSEWETNLANQKALSLGGYFIAHNLVLCREDGWKDLDQQQKCRWGGSYVNPPISSETYNIQSVSFSDDQLVLIMTSKEPGMDSISTALKFSLVDWSAKKSFRDMVGEIPFWVAMSDDDRSMVFITASTDLTTGGSTRTISKSGAIRRPIGTPKVVILNSDGRQTCTFECEVGEVLTPNPECRGPLTVPPVGGSASVGIRMTNEGPGALYKLKYERTTNYSTTVYPGRAPEIVVINGMTEGQEVLMPGERIDTEIERKCYPPIKYSVTQPISRVITGEQAGVSVTSDVTATSMLTPLSSEAFDISISRFDPKQALVEKFRSMYNPYDVTTYQPNPSLSQIEPKRLGTPLFKFDVSSPQETITEIQTITETRVVRPDPVPDTLGGREGDSGDGDN